MNPLTSRSFAPRGPKGLWDALVTASAGAGRGDDGTADDDVEVSEEIGGAHLAYMASLGGASMGEFDGGPVAEVIDLDAYRLTRIAV